ncbi:RNA polymerase sigma factor SigB [Alkalibacillus aidingensis]|uniref:RNA polymerase sigma factor SigB n=1 Tax=Alkalibacillus aidingensis TaxID=2747607 RepID=UPI001660B3E2|nr:RNA polymerase sigma factor SigB [Alkalibacillus aidingensis]
MTTKSQHHNNEEDVYELIRYLHEFPDDEPTQEKIIYKYENLVHSLARKYSHNSEVHEDLVQVGMLGLMAAIRRYDDSHGKSFESFAIPTIIGEIKRYIRDKTWSIHVPRRIKELGPKIRKAVEELTTDLQGSPSVADIANYLEVSEEEVLETMEMSKSYNALSTDRKIEADSDGSTVTILDLVGSQEQGYEQTNYKLIIETMMPLLSEREQKVLKYTYFENLSQKEAGERLGLSQMHVSRLQRRALRKLRDSMSEEDMEVLF